MRVVFFSSSYSVIVPKQIYFMNMSQLRIFSALVYFHFQGQEIPQVQDGRLAVVEDVYPLLHLSVDHPPCIDDRVCMGCFL